MTWMGVGLIAFFISSWETVVVKNQNARHDSRRLFDKSVLNYTSGDNT